MCLHWAVVLPMAEQCLKFCRADYTDSTLGRDPGLLSMAACAWCLGPFALAFECTASFTFDLRLGKITRRI